MLDDKPKIEVSVCMITYNHEKYITQAIEGVLSQQTTFPVELIIGEDCSTDTTRKLCEHYRAIFPEKIKLLLPNKNIGIKENLLETIKQASGKYIAFCEGDDYWTDPLKLQKQVDFLETHSEYSLCCHRYKIYNQQNNTWEEDYVNNLFLSHPEGFKFCNRDNFDTWITKTMTLLCRKEWIDVEKLRRYVYLRDVHICYHLLEKGVGYCMPFVGAVYRRQEGGVFSMLSPLAKLQTSFMVYQELADANPSDLDLQNYFIILAGVFADNIRNALYHHQFSKDVMNSIFLYMSWLRKKGGGKAVLRYGKKMLKSYIKGFK